MMILWSEERSFLQLKRNLNEYKKCFLKIFENNNHKQGKSIGSRIEILKIMFCYVQLGQIYPV